MENPIEAERKKFEEALNIGDIDQAISSLEKLKKANCDIRLTLRPEGHSQSEAFSFQHRKTLLLSYGIPNEVAEEIAARTRSDEETRQEARRRGLIS